MPPPFHARGAASGLPILDPSLHGLGFMRETIFRRFSELDFTHFGSIVAVVGILPAAWRYVHHAWREATSWVKRFFIASISIPANNALNRHVGSWVLEHIIGPRQMRFHTARTEVGRDLDPGASLKKSQRSIQYLPHWEVAWFWHEGRLFQVKRSLENFKAAMVDPTYDGIGGEELTISCLGRSSESLKQFIQECRAFAEKKAQFYVIIYSRDRYGMSWKPKYRKPLRQFDTIHFDEGVKRALIADIRNYLDPRTQKLYQSRSMPYRRGYLFYGPPGTGKSSLSTAIAGEFGLDLYEVKVPSIGNDADLEQMFQEIPPRCIVLLEDIDCVWTGREPRRERHINDDESSSSVISSVTLSGLLNVLDGVGSQEGRLVIMTTNHPDQLDAALIRPGRVDFRVYLGNISRNSAREMFMRMFAPDLLSWARISSEASGSLDEHVSLEQIRMLADQFAKETPEDTFTPSQLQGFFQLHLHSAQMAASSISDWVRRERTVKPEKEFAIC